MAAHPPSIEKHLDIPYDKRWDYLKPTIIRIYMEESPKKRMELLVHRMMNEYSFPAQPRQYIYHLRKWGIKATASAEEKDAVVSALGKRMHSAISTDDVSMRDTDGNRYKEVDKAQLVRHVRKRIRTHKVVPLKPGLFVQWSLPYVAFINSVRAGHDGAPSPFAGGPSTPSYVAVSAISPADAAAAAASPPDPSPATQIVRRKALLDRANMLLSGNHLQLLSQVCPQDRKVIVDFLNDFWIQSFVTAKYWGRGPERWDASMVFAKTMGLPDQPPSPQSGAPSPASGISTHQDSYRTITPPTQLCNWAIHVHSPGYQAIPDPPSAPTEQYDMDNEASWPQWEPLSGSNSLPERMAESLSETDFTSITSQELPISTSAIIQSTQRSPEQLGYDALAFAIIAGNRDTAQNILGQYEWIPPISDSSPSPFHLATSFMMGSKTCCTILNDLMDMQDSASIGLLFRDDKGHTVLDMLFVKIISAHTSVQVSDGFKGQARFPGEERDPCGRWDADSPCVRRLYASGQSRIPQDWKHPFCHTSVQAICHGITIIFSAPQSPSINTPSGLFSRDCQSCRQSLVLTPLHSLVLVAFFLAVNGRPGETLFGAIACLSALLAHGADPRQTAEISMALLMGRTMSQECDHQPTTAAQFAYNISNDDVLPACVPGAESGWKAFVLILQHAIIAEEALVDQNTRNNGDDVVMDEDEDMDEEDDTDDHDGDTHCKCGDVALSSTNFSCTASPFLGTIWACSQAEFLTYRRISVGDPWISPHFDLQAVSRWLEGKTTVLENGLKMGGMLKPYSRCGWFPGDEPLQPCSDDASMEYFMNMEDWRRSTYLPVACNVSGLFAVHIDRPQ